MAINLQEESVTPNEDISSLKGTMSQESSKGDLSNLRNALREALAEGSRRKSQAAVSASSGVLKEGAAPSVIQSAINFATEGLQQSRESMFSDIMEAYKEANDAKKKELDRIQELRLEFGSAIPASVTDLNDAINLAAPLIDKKNALERQEAQARINKLQQEQAADNDIEAWAADVAEDPGYISKVPSAIRTQVKVRADEIRKENEAKLDAELKENMKFAIEQKTTDYDGLREIIVNGGSKDFRAVLGNIDLGSLSADEKRSYLDYIDQLEQEEKDKKKAEGGSWFYNPPAARNENGSGDYANVKIDDRIAELKNNNPKISRDRLEVQLTKDGYQFNVIREKLPVYTAPILRFFK